MGGAGYTERKGKGTNAYRSLEGKHQAKRPLGKPRSRWQDNIKLDLNEIG
jgi:hypothetical protein